MAETEWVITLFLFMHSFSKYLYLCIGLFMSDLKSKCIIQSVSLMEKDFNCESKSSQQQRIIHLLIDKKAFNQKKNQHDIFKLIMVLTG